MLLSLLLFSLNVTALAQEPPAPTVAPPPATTPAPAVAVAEKPANGEKDAPKTIDQVVEGYEKLPGLFTFYRRVKAGDISLLMEITEEQIDAPFFLQATFGTGDGSLISAGEAIQDMILAFQRTPDERLLLVTPNLSFRAKADTPISVAVARGFPEGYLAIFSIKATQPERESVLIDVSSLFTGDITALSVLIGAPHFHLPQSRGGFTQDGSKTFLTAVKAFPENVVVEVQYHFRRSADTAFRSGADTLADPRSLPLKVVYNLWRMPEPGYRPRLADPRVGYFVNGDFGSRVGFQSFDDDAQADPNVYYIKRWRVQKADPFAAVSPPKQPIVFWIDRSVPVEYRQAVRDGILGWNAAFARIGITDAIVVREVPDDAEWDNADMRYNTIRWNATPFDGFSSSFAVFRENPLTGEIVNAGILIDAGITRVARLEDRYTVIPGNEDPPRPRNRFHCEYEQGLVQEGWYGMQALQAAGNIVDETAYAQALVREFVVHEMGHVLGLRHNFMGSTAFTPDELAAGGSTSASVMDYNPFNIYALGRPGVPYYPAGPGKYDLWAIEYGYIPIIAATPEEELPKLRAIAARANEPGLAYGSDELANNFDPAVVRYDLSADPLSYTEAVLQLNRKLIDSLAERLPAPGEGYRQFTLNLNRLLGMNGNAATRAVRYIGGYHVRINHRGDRREEPTLAPVPASRQYRALNLLNDHVFSGAAFAVPNDYYRKLIFNPFNDSDPLADNAFPMRENIGGIQQRTLRSLFERNRLTRIANAEFIAGNPRDAFRMVDLFSSVSGTIWQPMVAHVAVTPLQRDLQRAHLELMIEMAADKSAVPSDARMLARNTLRNLRPKIAAAGKETADQYTRIHLDDAAARIDRALAIPGVVLP
jgi:hypothetical protein